MQTQRRVRELIICTFHHPVLLSDNAFRTTPYQRFILYYLIFIIIGTNLFVKKNYSTVTLFAKLRGLSILQPRSKAVKYAISCNGIAANTGAIKSGHSGISMM